MKKKSILGIVISLTLLSGCGLVDQTIQEGKQAVQEGTQAIQEGTQAIQEGAQSIQSVANITNEIDHIYQTATEQTFNELIEPLRQQYQELTSVLNWEQLGIQFDSAVQEAINSANLDTFKQWVESEGYQQFKQSVDSVRNTIGG